MLHASFGEMVKPKNIVILGAGISGLALAWHLKKQYGQTVRLTVLEKSHRVGGWIETLNCDGFLFEQGPRGCRPKGMGLETLRLIQELRLEDQVIVNDPAAKLRYLYQAGKLKLLPTSLFNLLKSPWLLKMLCGPILFEWNKPKGNGEDESIYDFISRRLSPKIAECLIDPMTSGIYAGDIRKLSLKSCYSQMYEWEQKHHSLVKGMFAGDKLRPELDPFLKEMLNCSLFSLKNGMESLVTELARQVDADIQLKTPVESITIKKDGIDVMTAKGTMHAEHVFSTLPAQALAPLISPFSQKTGEMIGNLQSTSLVVVNVGYHSLKLKQKGFGYLIPSKEKEPILGMVWDSSIFPQQNKQPGEARLTVMLGGELHPGVIDLPEKEIISIVKQSLAKHMGIESPPDTLIVQRKRGAIPQYLVGHEEKVKVIKQQLAQLTPHLSLLGTSFNGVAVNESVAKAFNSYL